MLYGILYVLSISMQLTGGIALVLESFANIKSKVKGGYYGTHNFAIGKLEDVKEEDEKLIKKIIFPIFLSRFAFVILVIGTLISPLGSAEKYSKCCIILWIIVVTLVLNAIIFIITNIMAEKSSKTDSYKKMILR